MKTVFIYMLSEPDTGAIRYVGYTSQGVKARLRRHLRDPYKSHKGNWIKSLKSRGRLPVVTTLAEVEKENGLPLEAAYIQFFRGEGCDLVNTTSGGEGGEQTPEMRKKNSLAHLGKTSWLGKRHAPEACAKMSAGRLGEGNHFFGKKHSPATIEKMRAARVLYHVNKISTSTTRDKKGRFSI